jgi:D-alanyl-D-alanine carboxypeptidase (penicillin-binding protein 5/6)
MWEAMKPAPPVTIARTLPILETCIGSAVACLDPSLRQFPATVRGYKGLIVLVLVTVAALAAGLVLASRDDSSAAPSDPAATSSGESSTESEAREPAQAETAEPAVSSRTGLVYDERARDIEPGISAQAYIAIDAETGRVLIAHRDRQKRPIASLTKMMTALVTIERGGPDATVEIPYVATQVEPNLAGFMAGQAVTRRVLLWATLLESANDAAVALAYDGGNGSLARFFRKMNARARQLGMSDTRYRSASGLEDAVNWSSARDQAILARAALEEPLFAKMVSTKRKRLADWPTGSARELVNHNELLSEYAGTYGVKTGFTTKSGNCLVAAVRRNGQSIVAVVLGSQSIYYDMPRLVDKAFALLVSGDEQLADAA